MTRPPARRVRRMVGLLASASLLAGIATTALTATATADSDRLTTWTALNIRSGPGTNYAIVGGLYPGQLVTAAGPASGGWTPVIWNGKKAWVSSSYVRVAGSGASSSEAGGSTVGSSTPSTRTTTAAVNVRTGPSTTYRIITVLGTGTAVSATGAYRNGFAEVRYNGQSAWISNEYLADGTPGTGGSSTLPKVVGTKVTTTALMIRTTATSNYQSLGDIPTGTTVSVTGVVTNGMAQIVYNNAVRWVNNQYLTNATSGPSAPSGSLPAVVGYRYATTALMVRTTSTSSFTNLGDVPTGTKLAITGVVTNGVAQIVYEGAVRWVNANYLSSTAPTPATNISGISGTGLSGLTARSKALLVQLDQRYPQITWFNGVRADSLPDHPSGRAIDSMLPNYTSAASQALGWEIANWARANASSLGIDYIIFDQRIWSVARASEGWRLMADRGSDNANHKNHVHITVKP